MTAIDYTSLYSADIAVENENFLKDEDQWFLYCFAYLTQRLLRDNSICVFIPPTSDEKRRRKPLILDAIQREKSLFDVTFSQLPPLMKNLAVAETKNWANSHLDVLRTLHSNLDFWSHPRILKWWEWHDKNEMESHTDTLGSSSDVIGRDFATVVDDIGARDNMRRYALDIIIRGYYYRALYSGVCGLHPIRVGVLVQSDSLQESSYQIDRNDYASGLVLLKLLLDTENIDGIHDRLSQWMDCMKIAKRHLSTCRSITLSERRIELAESLRIPGWAPQRYLKHYQLFKKGISSALLFGAGAAVPASIVDANAPNPDTFDGCLAWVSSLFVVSDPAFQSAAVNDANLRSIFLSNMSDNVLSLAVRQSNEEADRGY